MTANNPCPCCSDSMLRHLSKQHSYWYCPSCRIEMPLIESRQMSDRKSKIKFPANSIQAVVNTKETLKTMVAFPTNSLS